MSDQFFETIHSAYESRGCDNDNLSKCIKSFALNYLGLSVADREALQTIFKDAVK